MGIHLNLVDFDRTFDTMSVEPVIVNDLPAFTEQNMDLIHKTIYTRHTPDMLSNEPSCTCKKSKGEFRKNTICPYCFTEVRDVVAEDLETVTWIRAPHGVDGLINPIVWTMLSERFSIGSFNLIQYLTDTQYRVPENQVGKFSPIIDQLPFERGLNNFIANFAEIKEFLFSLNIFKSRVKGRVTTDFLRKMLDENPSCLFAKHLPIPHRSLLVVEDGTSGGVYLDEFTPKAINAVLTLAGIDTPSSKGELTTSQRLRESRAVRAVARLAEYYYYVCSKRLAKKEGIFRKHVFATRSHFSFRAVVASITEPHHHEQIYIPWGVATSVFQLHLTNKLYRLGFTPNEAQDFLHQYATTYHPLLEHLFNELIAESPDPRGIAATLNRPPSLKRGSIQAVFIARVKRPEEGQTVSMSILIVRPLNCDFDGDALQFTLALDGYIANALKNLAPYKNSFSLDNIRAISSALEHSKTVVGTTSNWMETTDEELDPVILARMMALPDAPPPRVLH
ncbi:putative DNA-directed RNA polymerase subunit beta [Ralstonia phage RP12]|uniref:DNA-directed RNA polymerase n=1 Tax=Ralstonia phage RP12 TaxID=1923889 RepID=A0A1L7N198_9CAUD|nr:RNA polymerase beta subunit [Ralstonia phage RP12]BAW19261.1 putative DNA-directed RNA polymerase subunit beta [Ralstonia phage RP12]